jgi:hypothetical protein
VSNRGCHAHTQMVGWLCLTRTPQWIQLEHGVTRRRSAVTPFTQSLRVEVRANTMWDIRISVTTKRMQTTHI